MFKRISMIAACIAMMALTFAGCKKADQPAPAGDTAAPAAEAPAAPAADAAAPAPAPVPGAPDGQVPPPPAPDAPLPPPIPGAAPAPLPPVPPEAQASVDAMIDVMTSIANAGKKDTCAEVLEELKKLQGNEDVKQKLLKTKDIEKFPPDVVNAANEANKQRLIGLAFEMSAFQKCESAPESEAIDAAIKDILAPIAPEEPAPAPAADAPAPAVDAPAPAPAPAADAPAPAPAPAADAPAPAPAPAADAPAPAPAPAADAPAPAADAPAPAAG